MIKKDDDDDYDTVEDRLANSISNDPNVAFQNALYDLI